MTNQTVTKSGGAQVLLPPDAPIRGLVVDWGGVLTTDLGSAMSQWAAAEQVELKEFGVLMRTWLGMEAENEAWVNPVHALERGEVEIPDFECKLAEGLAEQLGHHVEPSGLIDRLLGGFRTAPQMTALVRRARDVGIRTGLLSNSWGTDKYPDDLFDGMFDIVVISGHVGMRKPEDRIYLHTLELMELTASQCVFIDDMAHNVAAAAELGFVAIQHESYERTAVELEALFGVPLT